MECTLCIKRYVGKAGTVFNNRLNNHRKDVKDSNIKLACKHFQTIGHNFNKHAKFIIIVKLVNVNNVIVKLVNVNNVIVKLVNVNNVKDILRERIIQRENFWI